MTGDSRLSKHLRRLVDSIDARGNDSGDQGLAVIRPADRDLLYKPELIVCYLQGFETCLRDGNDVEQNDIALEVTSEVFRLGQDILVQ